MKPNFKKLQEIRNINNNKRKQNETEILKLLQENEQKNKNEIEKLKKINKKLIKQNQLIIKKISDYQKNNRNENIFQNDLFII